MSAQTSLSIAEILAGMVGGGALAKLVEAFQKGRAPKKDVMTAVAQAADLLMDGMREDLDVLRREMAAQKTAHSSELAAMKAAHHAREEDCERRLDALSGELRQARQEVASLVRQLRDPASTQPGGVLEGAVIQLSDGGASVVSTAPERKAK